MVSKFKYARSTLFFTGKKLDIPREINCKSKSIEIKNNTVIDLWYKLIFGSKENVFSFFNDYFYKNKVKKVKIRINKKYKIFTFPNSKNLRSVFFLFRLYAMDSRAELVNSILITSISILKGLSR